MREAYTFLRITISMVLGAVIGWRTSRRLLRERHEARIREAHAVYPKEDPRSTNFVYWAREAFMETYGPPTDPERLAHRNRAILGTARELLEDLDPPLRPEDIERALRQLETQLGHVSSNTPAP